MAEVQRGERRRRRHSAEAVDDRQLAKLRAMSREELQGAVPLIEEIAAAHLPRSQVSYALNAYRSIVEFDATGDVTPRAAGYAGAETELRELIETLERFDVAAELLTHYALRWPRKRNLRELQAMLPEGFEPGSIFRDDKNADVQIAPCAGADVTFIAFGGRGNGFGISFNVLNRHLAKTGANVVYLRDLNNALYMRGIRSLANTPSAAAGKLKDIAASLGTKRLVCIGNSIGGFGALYYGALLSADHVLNFSGPSSIELALKSPSKADYYESACGLLEQGVAKWPDIRGLYEQRPSTKVEIFYADGHKANREQAEHMAGLPNVTLEPLRDFSRHVVIQELVREGRFKDILARAARAD